MAIWIQPEKAIENINKDSSFVLEDFLAKIKKKELSPIKDDTDMALAVEDAVANGCEEIVIFGGLGGARMSHTLLMSSLYIDLRGKASVFVCILKQIQCRLL